MSLEESKSGSVVVAEEHITGLIDRIYSSSKIIITEFVEDGVVSGFKDIPMIVWYNALSSLCALALRIPEIKGNEKLQEKVVYETMLRVLQNDVPLDNKQRTTALNIYKRVAPTVIDVLIPGKDDLTCCGCFPLKK